MTYSPQEGDMHWLKIYSFHQLVNITPKSDRPGKYNNLDPRNWYHVTSSGPITSRYLSKLSNIIIWSSIASGSLVNFNIVLHDAIQYPLPPPLQPGKHDKAPKHWRIYSHRVPIHFIVCVGGGGCGKCREMSCHIKYCRDRYLTPYYMYFGDFTARPRHLQYNDCKKKGRQNMYR